MFNRDELIIDKVRQATCHDLETGRMFLRLKNIEDPSLTTTAEGEEIVDAIGSPITTLYKAKKATFSGSNSLMSTDLAAAQYGTEKEVASAEKKITDYAYEIITVESGATTVELKQTPKSDVRFIYQLVDGEMATTYTAGESATATTFSLSGKTITLPTGFTGKLYVEYDFENANAMKVSNKAHNFPTACALHIYAYFKDKCNENKSYVGKVIAPRAKLNPESVELSLTSTGKHPFEFNINTAYCDEEDAELFAIIVSE